MSTPADFTIESDLQQPLDTFTARYAGAGEWLARTDDEAVTLSSGQEDVVGIPHQSPHIVAGQVWKYELIREVTPTKDVPVEKVTTVKRGFDAMRALTRAWLRHRYVRETSPTPTSSQPSEAGAIPESRGAFSYEYIAQQAVAAAAALSGLPLTLVWNMPANPTIRRDFTANARAIDVLKQLIQPWTYATAYRADLYISGNTVICRQRQPSPTAAVTLSIAQMRPPKVRVVSTPPDPIGTIIVRGDPGNPQTTTPPGGGGGGGGGSFVVGGTFDVHVDTGTVTADYSYRDGKPPFGVLTSGDIRTFQPSGSMVRREQLTQEWTASIFDGGQRVNVPQLTRGFRQIAGLDPTGTWRDALRTEEQLYSYDGDRYLTGVRTLVQTFVPPNPDDPDSGILRDSELQTRTLVGNGPGLDSEWTTVYVPNSDVGFLGPTARDWRVKSQTPPTTGGGSRPGGPGRARPAPRPTTDLTGTPITPGTPGAPVVVISAGAANLRTVEISAPDLTAGQAQQIVTQLRAQSPLWEHELFIDAPSIPWLERGSGVSITGLQAEDGTPITLAAATVYSLTYDHAGGADNRPTMMKLHCGWWGAS